MWVKVGRHQRQMDSYARDQRIKKKTICKLSLGQIALISARLTDHKFICKFVSVGKIGYLVQIRSKSRESLYI